MVTTPFQAQNIEFNRLVQEAEQRLNQILETQEWLEDNIDLLIEEEEEEEIDWEEDIVGMKTPPPSSQ